MSSIIRGSVRLRGFLWLVEEHAQSFTQKSEGHNKHCYQACASQNLLVSFVTLKSQLR